MANSHINVFKHGSVEREKLEKAATLMNILYESEGHHYVGETYFDLGQGWKWTTILCERPNGDWTIQALCPRDQEAILMSTNGKELLAAVNGVFARRA
jgi:hypothetical protein